MQNKISQKAAARFMALQFDPLIALF